MKVKIYTDKQKISQYLDLKGISKRRFYEKTGFSSGFLDKGSSLGVDKLKIIVDNYPDFNYNCLITDEEEFVKEKSSLDNNNSIEATVRNQERQIDQLYRVIEILATKLDISKESLYKLAGKL